MPEYFDRYINLVDDIELAQAFDDSIRQLDALDSKRLAKLDGKRYEPGKWTLKENLQHLIDWERILSYRTLLFARREGSIPQGIDQDLLAEGMNANSRPVEAIMNELKIVRASTKAMFDSFDDEMLQYKGVNWKSDISVLAMGFAMIGHQMHHLRIIEDKYFPMLK